MQNKCMELNEFLEDDSPDGHITLSTKGVDLPPRHDSTYVLTISSFILDFEEDEFLTSLTQVL